MSRKDNSGYYAALGLDQSATSDQIKRAFKAKAQACHPDRNPAPEATRQFQLINEAYHVLGDPQARAEYDARSYEPPESDAAPTDRAADPVVCSVCQRVTAQPRYTIYRHVISAILITWRMVDQGVFCSECGAEKAYRASLKTWLLGWWGFPWGPIYSIQAISWNMRGGEQPPLNNLSVLGWQAIYFSRVGRSDLARAVARAALTFGNRIPETERLYSLQTRRLIAAMEKIVASGGPNDRLPAFRDLWGVGSRPFRIQLGGAGLFAVLIGSIALFTAILNRTPAYKHVPPTESVAPAPPPGFQPVATASTPPSPTQSPVARELKPDTSVAAQGVFNEPALPLPATGWVRALWRSNPETLLAPLKIVTPAGGPNYYVKIVDWKTHAATLVFFVRSGDATTVRVPLGLYELRYAAGESWYGEEYLFGPDTEYAKADESFDFRAEGEEVSGFSVEMIKRINGNMSERRIRASDF